MSKEALITIKVCDWIIKICIYSAIFLMPIIFLPFSSDPIDFNKQTILIFLAFISLFAWMLKVLVSGTLILNKNKINIFALLLGAVYFISTIFSVDKYGSFWGWSRVASESFVTIISFLIFFFIISNVFLKKDIFKLIYVFSISALIAEIFGVLQLLELFVLPINFAKNISFNTLGGPAALGIFSALLIPLMMILMMFSKKWLKVVPVLFIALSTLSLILINFKSVWWIAFFGSVAIMMLGILKKNLFDGRWMALPTFFLAVSLFFIIFNPQAIWIPQKVNEISISHTANLQIDISAAKERPILGSGPGTFSYNFLKFKSPDFNKTAIWNIVFNEGSSKILTEFATLGMVGTLTFLFFISSVLFFVVRFFWNKNRASNNDQDISLGFIAGIFASLLASISAFFLHGSNLTLDFVFFFLISLLTVLIFNKEKNYELKPSSKATLIVTFVFTLLFIFGLGITALAGQRYVAEVKYYSGFKSLNNGEIDEGIKKLESAVSINSAQDLYLRQLSQAYLLKIQNVINDKNISQDDKVKQVQLLVANTVNFSKAAADLNPKNVNNWLVRGYIFQSLIGLVNDSSAWAINSYDESLKYDPNNPYTMTQKGIVYFQQKDYQDAKNSLDKALELKSDYSNALYFSGLVYDQLGQKDVAVNKFTTLSELNPESKNDIQKIINNLRSGSNALDGLVQKSPTAESPQEPSIDSINKETDDNQSSAEKDPKTEK